MKQSSKGILGLMIGMLAAVAASTAAATPVTVTGYNQDIILEGPLISPFSNPTAVSRTTTSIDGGNRVIAANDYVLAGLPSGAAVTYGSADFQLPSTTGLNALYLVGGASGALTLTTPAAYQSLTLLGTGTEGNASLTVTVNFVGGSSTVVPVTLNDWGVPGPHGAVRISRNDGDMNNIYLSLGVVNIPVSDQGKLVESLSISNAAGGARGSILGVSGAAPASVPTMTEWAMILLALGLVGAGGLMIARRREKSA